MRLAASRGDPARRRLRRCGEPLRRRRRAVTRRRPSADGRRRPAGSRHRRRAASASTVDRASATGSRPRCPASSGGSSRSLIGKSVEEVEPPRPGVDERRLEDPGVGPATDDDDVVGAGAGAELLDDRLDDRVGRDRPGQALEDPGEALGLGAAAAPRAPGRRAGGGPRRSRRRRSGPVIAAVEGTGARRRTGGGPTISPRAKNVPAKMSQERRIPGSSAPADGRRSVGGVTFGDEHAGPVPLRRKRAGVVLPAAGVLVLPFEICSTRRRGVRRAGGHRLRRSAAPRPRRLRFIRYRPGVGDGDQLGRGPAVGRERRDADRDADRDVQPAVVAEGRVSRTPR